MSIKKKILSITIIPVLLLGIVSIFLTFTTVKGALINQIEEALKGTAAATLAAYDQNTGDYLQTSNGDIWKGSYNISKSESLVDRIKKNTDMDVTFFYGNERIMTSAADSDGNRILGSPAGDVIITKVLQNGEEYFSENVSLEGNINYGYYMPVYQNGSVLQEFVSVHYLPHCVYAKRNTITERLNLPHLNVWNLRLKCVKITPFCVRRCHRFTLNC